MQEAGAQLYDTHLEDNAQAPPGHGHARETQPPLSKVCTFTSAGEGSPPGASSGSGPAHQDTAAAAVPLTPLLFSVTSVVEKVLDDSRVRQGGDVPQIMVILGNLPQYPSGDLPCNDSSSQGLLSILSRSGEHPDMPDLRLPPPGIGAALDKPVRADFPPLAGTSQSSQALT